MSEENSPCSISKTNFCINSIAVIIFGWKQCNGITTIETADTAIGIFTSQFHNIVL